MHEAETSSNLLATSNLLSATSRRIGYDPSLAFDADSIQSAIQKRMHRCRRLPGTPIYVPILDQSIKVTPDELCPLQERERRKKIQSCRFKVSLLVNDKPVKTTEEVSLTHPNFVVDLRDMVSIKLLSVPKEVKCIVKAVGTLTDVPVAEIFLPVPAYGSCATFDHHQFAGPQITPDQMSEEFRESQLRLASKMDQPNDVGQVLSATAVPSLDQNRFLMGELELGMYWEVLDSGNSSAPLHPELASGVADREEAGEKHASLRQRAFLAASKNRKEDIDPNDPRNSALLDLLRKADLLNQGEQLFRASQFQQELFLFDTRYYVPSARRQVFQARNNWKVIHEPVPLLDHEIPEHMYELSGIRTSDQVDSELAHVNELQLQAQKKTLAKLGRRNKEIFHVSEVVREDALPVIQANNDLLNALFKPRRNLRVERAPPKPVASPSACRLVVNVVRGQNFPVHRQRLDAHRDRFNRMHSLRESKMPEDEVDTSLRTYVEVSFQSSSKVTACTRGANPSWNEILLLPIEPPGNDYSPQTLQAMQDHIHFHIFDENSQTSRFADDRFQNIRQQRVSNILVLCLLRGLVAHKSISFLID